MIEIPTNTEVWITVGPFLDKSDGISPETGVTVANSAITLIADAGAGSTPTVVLDSVAGNDGTNTLVHVTGDDGGVRRLTTNALEQAPTGGSAPSAATIADAVWDEALSGHSTAGTAGLALSTASSGGVDPSVLADAIWDEALSGHSTAGTTGKKLTDLVNADLTDLHTDVGTVITNLATVDSIIDNIHDTDLPAVKTDTAAIKAKTDNIPASPASTTNITAGTITTVTNLTNAPTAGDFTATMKASITSAVPTAPAIKTALEADGGKLDHLWEMTEDDGGVRRLTTNALEQAPTGGSAPSAATIADAVWDEALSGHSTAGTAGLALSTASSGGVDPSVLADAIWDEALSGHSTAGTTGKKLTDLVNADLSGVATAAALDAVDNYVDTEIAAIKAVTDKLNTAVELDGAVYRFTINALENAPAGEGGGGVAPTVQEIDDQLSATHGDGLWITQIGVVLPAYTVPATQGRDVIVVQGDTPRITFDLVNDYTGWTPRFGAKAELTDTTYVIGPKDGTWVDAAVGDGYVDITALETATPGRYYAEIELQNGIQRLTSLKFNLRIIAAVIQE